jgi:uncharacterized protein YpbB
MNYFLLLMLYCLNQLKGERSIYSIYHLLKGKRSSQTIQDAKLYDTSALFGVLPNLQRTEIDEAINKLYTLKAVKMITDNSYTVTSVGEKALRPFTLPNSLNGWKYVAITNVFWGRLSLTTQSISNLIHFQSKFIPVHRDSQLLAWVKSFLKGIHVNRTQIGEKLYDEIIDAFYDLDEQRATIFVSKLTSHHRIGNTNEQIAEMQRVSTVEVTILFASTLHYLLSRIDENEEKYPLLSKIAKVNKNELSLTQSTEKTYDLLKRGKSIEDITRLRYLKRNTIEDHIVEIALTDKSFDTMNFISPEKYKTIESCIKSTKTKQLKTIKQALSIQASYFEIRLVLAKVGGFHEA